MKSRAQTRSDKQKWKKKKHPASKCGNAKCTICHSDKVLNIPEDIIEKSKSLPVQPPTDTTKVFSVEDMEKCWDAALDWFYFKSDYPNKEQFLNSLKQV